LRSEPDAAGRAYTSHVDVTLIAVAVVAGLATFLSPCVLPVLPVVAAASATGGRRRPLGIAAGLALAFVCFTLLASRLLSALGLPQDLLRNVAIGLLAVAGAGLLVPAIGDLAGRAFRPLAARAGERLAGGDGFWSGVSLGAGLALVWTPCAGPILAAVSALSAERRLSPELVLITIAYSAGATLPIFALALLGHRASGRLAGLRSGGAAVRRASGAVLLAAAFLFTTDIPTQLAASAPGYVSAIQHVERSGGVAGDLRKLTANAKNAPAAVAAGSTPDSLRDYGPAPNFAGITKWINTSGSRPLSLQALRGKVVLVDFWTYSCVNCIRTLPYLKAWYARYHRDGLVIVGVHTPEFAFEHVVSNVERAVQEHGIRYPVAVDDRYATWDAWANQYWPADYLIDRDGHVRDAHFGEGGYTQTQDDIRQLLGERGAGPMTHAVGAISPSASVQTPETYLGTYRAAGYVQHIAHGVDFDYGRPARPPANGVALGGHWTVGVHQIVAGPGAHLLFTYVAPRIYLVAAPPASGAAALGVTVDGRRRAPVRVAADDLYELAHLPTAGPHVLDLAVPPGTNLYSFTFG
jgi:cytochrome c biogenesis protein CcdA/thiol-disulfide isomerase/thioredoxin